MYAIQSVLILRCSEQPVAHPFIFSSFVLLYVGQSVNVKVVMQKLCVLKVI